MSIEIACAGCGQMLRVADEHAGKMARCPKCGTVVPVPQAAAASAPPQLQPLAAPGPVQTANPFAPPPPGTPVNPYAPPTASYKNTAPYGQQHRGGAVLTFGILSLTMIPFGMLCCMPLGVLPLGFGIAAWVMGAIDLRAMREGRMDPDGRSSTLTGMILGIVTTALVALAIIVGVIFIVLANANAI